ncbi:hypothetical protein [Actinokineospora terrae]|uniref:hypothetical protein n=1 Tax=Actinokineospora terrae TaxID=155974 RepID=UPI0031838191
MGAEYERRCRSAWWALTGPVEIYLIVGACGVVVVGAQVRQPQLVDDRGDGQVAAVAAAWLVPASIPAPGRDQGGADRCGQAKADE